MELPHNKRQIIWFPDDQSLQRRVRNNQTFTEQKALKNVFSNYYNHNYIDPFTSIAVRNSLRPGENSIHAPSGQQINNLNGPALTVLPPPPGFLFAKPEAPNFQSAINERMFEAGMTHQTLQRNHRTNIVTAFQPDVKVGEAMLLPAVTSGEETITVNLDYSAQPVIQPSLPEFLFSTRPSSHISDFAQTQLNFF